jgi:hypothetical protein
MLRAAKLDAALYEEVEADKTAMGQAIGVVVLSSVAAGLGSVTIGRPSIVASTLLSLVGWFIWSYMVFIIGTKLLPEPQTKADYGELLRTIGFSSAPGVIRLLGMIPALFNLVNLAAGVWMLAAMIVAVRQALDYKGIGRAIGVCVIGWVIQLLFLAILLQMAGLQP